MICFVMKNKDLLSDTRKVHVITWDNKEYDRRASMLEIELLRQGDECVVRGGEEDITLDFRLLSRNDSKRSMSKT